MVRVVWRPLWRVQALVAMGAALPAAPAMIDRAAAQTIEEESGRIPGRPEPSIASSLPRALADPGGVRSVLGREGVTFHVNYIGDVLGNPTGGIAQGTFYDGRLELALEADLEKLIGWPGLSFFANAYQIHGQSITANDLGVLMPVSFIEALPDTRLDELWFEQKLFDGGLSIRFGQLSADSDFLISQRAQAFLNGTWGWASIAGVNLPDGGPSYPWRCLRCARPLCPRRSLQSACGAQHGRSRRRLRRRHSAGVQSERPGVSLQRSFAVRRGRPTSTTRAQVSSPGPSRSGAGVSSARPSNWVREQRASDCAAGNSRRGRRSGLCALCNSRSDALPASGRRATPKASRSSAASSARRPKAT